MIILSRSMERHVRQDTVPDEAAVRRYCNEGHDIVTAQYMRISLKERPVRGTTAAAFSMTEERRTLQTKKIPNYSSLHNF